MADFLDDFNAEVDPLLMDATGDEVTFIPSSGGSFPIKGHFNDAFYLTDAETGVQTVSPAVECLEMDVPNAQGGFIVRKGRSYAVKFVQQNGEGMVLLVLRKVANDASDSVNKGLLMVVSGMAVSDANDQIIRVNV